MTQVYLVSCYIQVLQMKRWLNAFHCDHEAWSIFLKFFLKINGLVNDSHQSLTLRRRTRGIDVLHHETTPVKQGTHPMNEQGELAWGSLQGEDKMWASRLRMALSLNGLHRPHEGKQAIWQRQLNTCPTISTALTLWPRFPRAWHKNYSP